MSEDDCRQNDYKESLSKIANNWKNNPATKFQRDFAFTQAAKLQKQWRNSPAAKLSDDVRNSSFGIMNQQLNNFPAATERQKIFNISASARRMGWLNSSETKRQIEIVRQVQKSLYRNNSFNSLLHNEQIRKITKSDPFFGFGLTQLTNSIQQVPDDKLFELLPKEEPQPQEIVPNKAAKERARAEVEHNSTPNKNTVSNESAQNDKANAQLDSGYENIVQNNSSSLWSISSLKSDVPSEIRSYLINKFLDFIFKNAIVYGPGLAFEAAKAIINWVKSLN